MAFMVRVRPPVPGDDAHWGGYRPLTVCCHTDPEVGGKKQVGNATTAPETATAALGHCEVQAAHCMMLCLTLLYC